MAITPGVILYRFSGKLLMSADDTEISSNHGSSKVLPLNLFMFAVPIPCKRAA